MRTELPPEETARIEEHVAEVRSIHALFVCSPECPVCLGSGHVCEDHPTTPWKDGDGCCGAAGMPCPSIAKARSIFDAVRP